MQSNTNSRKLLEQRLGGDIVKQLIGDQTQTTTQNQLFNINSIACPACTCSILKPSVGELILVDQELSDHENKLSFLYNANLPNQIKQYHWLIDDMFKFENIGISKAIPNTLNINETTTSETTKTECEPKQVESTLEVDSSYRYLLCAECNFGPLGWKHSNSKCCYLQVFFK